MSCTRDAHQAMHDNSEEWAAMRLVGYYADGIGPTLEMRNCPYCRSTIARELSPYIDEETP